MHFQRCYHSSAGNVRCFPERGAHRTNPNIDSGFGGGSDGRLVDPDCLFGYQFLGITCSRPVNHNQEDTFEDAISKCGAQGDMLYFPPDKMQNIVFREAFKFMNHSLSHTVWIGIRRSVDGWLTSNGQKLTPAMEDWAEGEPIVVGDCAIADATVGYVRWV